MENQKEMSLEDAAKEYAHSKECHAVRNSSDSDTEYNRYYNRYYNAVLFGANWQKERFIKEIDKALSESFKGWSEDAIAGYITACERFKNNNLCKT